jgi:hypothetical protein
MLLSFPLQAGASAGLFSRMFAGCPDNAFQKVQPGMQPFTLMQRVGAPIRNGLKLAAVGLIASFIGVAVTNAIVSVRTLLDPSFSPLNAPQVGRGGGWRMGAPPV